MAPPPSTIIDVKKSFLATQVRALSAPLQPSTNWRQTGASKKRRRDDDDDEEGDISDKIVGEVIGKGMHLHAASSIEPINFRN
jgi:Kinetochore complex Fta4 of Sim4 subunit, or CENP-50